MPTENKAHENRSGGHGGQETPQTPSGGWLADVRLALAFLTRLPVGGAHAGRPLSDAAWAFPLAGVVVGGFGAAAIYLCRLAELPTFVGAVVALAVMALVTGALHEDGLADVADGFGGGAVRSRKLEIMRDSRIGSFGVLALIFSVALRASALAAIGPGVLAGAVLMSAAVASRAVLPALMRALPNARDDGLAHSAGRPGAVSAGVSLALGGGLMLLFLQPHLMTTIAAFVAAVVATVGLGVLARRQIGGQTGDVIGAAQQVAETAVLLAAVAVLS
ncbi:MAG: adenosylcobinamide-GDP ribazoletransferase [Rhodospirillales bacterium]